MAFPDASIPVLDSGNRADEDPISDGGKWSHWKPSNTGDLAIVSNHIAEGAVAGEHTNYWNNATFSGHVQVAIKAQSSAGGSDALYFGVHLASPNLNTYNGYFVEFNTGFSGTCIIYIATNGSRTQLAATTGIGTWTTNDIVGAEVNSGTINAYINNTVVLTTTDSTYTNGYLGLGLGSGTTSVFNDFYGGSTGVAYTLSLTGDNYIISGSDLRLGYQGPKFAMRYTV